MFKKTFTLQALALLLLSGSVAVTQTSCSRAEQQGQETAADTDQAYTDFKTFVANAEAGAENVGNKTKAEWDEETNQLKTDYDTRVSAVEANMATWDDTRKQEYEQLKGRYTAAYDRRMAAYQGNMSAGGADVAMNTTTGGSMSGAAMENGATAATSAGRYYKPSNPAAQLTAANARQTYENFVQMVKQNEDRYEVADWRNINAEWRALDAKYDQIKGQVSAGDKAEIAKEKLKYAAFKSYDKAESRVSQGADVATGNGEDAAAKGGGVQLEQSARNAGSDAKALGKDAKNTGKDVAEGAEKTGSKVGNAVKGAYKEAKSEVKNTDND